MKNYFNDYFSPLDIHLGDFISSFDVEKKNYVFLAAALLSRNLRAGHVCLDLKELAESVVYKSETDQEIITCPPLDAWRAELKNNFCVGIPGDFKPLIIDEQDRLYLQRYWQYENETAGYLIAKISSGNTSKYDRSELQKKLTIYFNDKAEEAVDWPKVAAVAALLKRILIITGGPGTGKTTTIARIMAFLLDMQKTAKRIALAAPTGKAATRLQESVKNIKENLNCSLTIKTMLPEKASTIHRLLGSKTGSSYFQFNEKNKLPFDLIIVDEASMVDLPLMAKLLSALSADASLILLGDNNQLASIDAGVVLGDICANFPLNIFSAEFSSIIRDLTGESIPSGNMPPGIQDSVIQLQHNYRFSDMSGIGLLSRAVGNGRQQEVLDLLQNEKYEDIQWTIVNDSEKSFRQLRPAIIEKYANYIKAVNSGVVAPEEIFDLFERFRILCALRVGSWGTQRVNSYIEKILTEEELINNRSIYYEGRPVLILNNYYRLNLFNGDVGIILQDRDENNQLKAFFRKENGGFKKILPSRLPAHETVWAMTIHKSQGSEFEQVYLLLSEKDLPVITREHIYTGITRAKGTVNIWAGKEILTRAISRRISRQTGLADALKKCQKTATSI